MWFDFQHPLVGGGGGHCVTHKKRLCSRPSEACRWRTCDGLWGSFTFFSHSFQIDSAFYWLQSELSRWSACWENTDVSDRQFCVDSRIPKYSIQILSLGASCKLRKCTCYRQWAAWSVQGVCKTDPPPVDNRTGKTKGDNLPQLVSRIWTKWP